MNARTILTALALAGILGGALVSALPLPAPTQGHLTAAPSYLVLDANVTGEIKPLLTTNEAIGDEGYKFLSIPDGIGIRHGLAGTIDVYVNHELNAAVAPFLNAHVSKVSLSRLDASVVDASYAVGNTSGYQRLCSSSLVEGYGFEHPLYLTGEEVEDGIGIALDTETGDVHELPWLGELAFESILFIPHLWLTQGKTAVLVMEDGDATESELYMYVADSAEGLLTGTGQLYVYAAGGNSYATTYYGETLEGGFVPVDWDWATEDHVALDDAAVAAGAFKFIRVEDGATDKRPGFTNVLYFADTGNDRDENGALIPPGENGQTFERGRMFKLAFGDALDATLEIMIDGNDPAAPGYGVMINPDNVDTSLLSLMIQEDRIGATRSTPIPGAYDVTRNAKILRYELATGEITKVAYSNQTLQPTRRYGDWEASGIVDASLVYGPGAWLVDVQAHGYEPNGPAGQLLLMRVVGS